MSLPQNEHGPLDSNDRTAARLETIRQELSRARSHKQAVALDLFPLLFLTALLFITLAWGIVTGWFQEAPTEGQAAVWVGTLLVVAVDLARLRSAQKELRGERPQIITGDILFEMRFPTEEMRQENPRLLLFLCFLLAAFSPQYFLITTRGCGLVRGSIRPRQGFWSWEQISHFTASEGMVDLYLKHRPSSRFLRIPGWEKAEKAAAVLRRYLPEK